MKYWAVFKISWSNGFVYPLNFLLWRFRSVIVILTIYLLWDAMFAGGNVIAGYTQAKIITYIFLTLILRSVIMGNRSMDSAGEISGGRLSNYLLKPLNFHFYWFTRDIADKLLNIVFIVVEVVILNYILKPNLFIPSDPLLVMAFSVSVAGAIVLNYLMGMVATNFSFWTPGNAWGFWFIYLIFQDFLGGTLYPLDIFGGLFYQILKILPFGYLLYFPAGIFLEKFNWADIISGLGLMVFWIGIFYLVVKIEWQLGIKDYKAEGR